MQSQSETDGRGIRAEGVSWAEATGRKELASAGL